MKREKKFQTVSGVRARAFATGAAVLLALSLWGAGCDIGSTDSASGVVSDSSGTIYDFSGTYYSISEEGGPLVNPAQSGRAITWLRLTQYGSVLEGYDSGRQKWSGKISSVSSGGNASFTLDGSTSAGAAVDIVGVLRYADGASTLDGSWIESSGRQCNIQARAAVSAPTTNSSESATLTISPTSATVARGATRVFKASNGNPAYSWHLSSTTYGTLSTTTGASTVFTASPSATGSVTLTVSDSLSSSASATITVE